MRKVVEVFEYEVPDEVKEYPTVEDYITDANMATCPFYDGMEFIPDVRRTKIEITQIE